MTSQKLAGFLKSHWLFAIIAIAVLAFLAGAFTSNRGVADTPTPTAEPKPAATGWWFATPTNEEFSRDLEELRARRAASGSDGEKLGSRSGVTIPTPVPRSTAEAEAWAAPPGRALYFFSTDEVIHLPEGVTIKMQIPLTTCAPRPERPCPVPPLTVLQNEEGAEIILDRYGEALPEHVDALDEFPFLKE